MTCLFCQIATSQIKSDIVYEDQDIVAFSDIHPQAPIHKLIIPRKHIATLNDLTPEDATLTNKMLLCAHTLAKKYEIHETGYRLICNVNAGAGQTVYHIHFHVLGGRPLQWPPG